LGVRVRVRVTVRVRVRVRVRGVAPRSSERADSDPAAATGDPHTVPGAGVPG
jgi:hypothetical protein